VEQKVIQTAGDTQYPAVFGLFRDSGGTATKRVVARDHELPSRIAAYIQQSAKQMEEINRHLAHQFAATERVILWGAGQFAMKLLALPCLAKTRVRAVVDNNPILRGKTLAGASIVGPRDIADTREPIIIATLLHADEISAQIRSLGLTNPVFALLQDSSAKVHREVHCS